MNIDASALFQIVAIGVSSWTLIEVIRIGKMVERHDQKLTDLPCDHCEPKK